MQRETASSRSVVDGVFSKSTIQPNKTAIIHLSSDGTEDVRISYGQLANRTVQIAQALSDRLERGSRVVLLHTSPKGFLEAFLGCLHCGMIAIPMPMPKLGRGPSRIDAVLADGEPEAILTSSEETATALSAAFPEQIVLASDTICSTAGSAIPYPSLGIDPCGLAYLQYTSGSTSSPKGVCITHENILANLEAMRAHNLITGPETMVTWLPHFHDMGLIWGLLFPLWRGDTVVTLAPAAFIQNPSVWLQAISRFRGTLSGAPNFAYDLCVQKVAESVRRRLDLSSLKVCYNAAEPVHAKTIRSFNASFSGCGLSLDAVRPAYGLAESTLAVSIETRDHLDPIHRFETAGLAEGKAISTVEGGQELVSCGPIVGGHDLRIVDPNTCEELPEDEIGEIWTRGPSVADGFWNQQPDDSEFSGYIASTETGPFLRTGDLGFLHEGRLFICGRQKDIVIHQGRNLAPQDLERTVWEAHPAIAPDGVAAFSVVFGDLEEECLVVAAELDRGSRKTHPEEIAEAVRIAISAEHQAQLRAVVVLGPKRLPKTSSGKVRRRTCRDLFLEGYPDAIAIVRFGSPRESGSTATDSNQVVTILTEVLKADRTELKMDVPLSLQGLDSLKAVQLQARLAEEAGIRVRLESLQEELTPSKLSRMASNSLDTDSMSDSSSTAKPPDSFPLTDIQKAYWVGRNPELELGGISCQAYLEFETTDLDTSRLESAWNRLLERHYMLRCQVDENGEQRIRTRKTPYRVAVSDLRSRSPQEQLAALCLYRNAWGREVSGPHEDDHFRVEVTRVSDATSHVHLRFDLLVADFESLAIFSRELSALYENPSIDLGPTPTAFHHHAIDRAVGKKSEAARGILTRWRKQAPNLPPPPDFPAPRAGKPIGLPHFCRREACLDPHHWLQLQAKASHHGVTASSVVLSVFAETLARWSARPDFCLTLTLFDRSNRFAGTIGDFTTTAPVVRSAKESFLAVAKDIRKQIVLGMDSRTLGGVALQRELGSDNAFAPSVVFTSMLGQGDSRLFPWLGKPKFAISQTPQVGLDHQVGETPDGLHLVWDAVDALYPDGMLDDMFASYFTAIRTVVDADWNQPLQIALPPRQLQLRSSANETEQDLPSHHLQTLFERSADLFPDSFAVIDSRRNLTYSQLERESNSLACRLREAEVAPGDLVTVALEKGWEQAVAVLAILKAGAAYLPLDPNLPLERRAIILEQARSGIVVASRAILSDREWPTDILSIAIEDEIRRSAARFATVQSLTDVAYVIFTSGSTGTPKGVMIDHRGACNTIVDLNTRYQIGSGDRVLALSALNFDLSVYDLFGMWAAGGTVVLPDLKRARDPQHWLEAMHEHRITLWNTVPALMEMLVENAMGRSEKLPDSLRLVFMSGDWIPVTLPEKIRSLRPTAKIVSMGGATEASIWSILHEIETVDPLAKSIPYGKPMANQTFHILDDKFRHVPEWVPGRLFIGGIGVAKGYSNAQQLTDERFLTTSISSTPLYWTGDLGRYLPDGSIEFLGREDFQVKIQGYRIELEEIESVLLRHPAIRNASVTVGNAPGGSKRLVGYFVAKTPDSVESGSIREFLAEHLPAYMVPGIFAQLPELPLSANGKVNRKALPEIKSNRTVSKSPAATNEGMELLSKCWMDILGLEAKPSSDASFFELGGDSLAATRLTAKLRKEHRMELSMPKIYENPTLEQMARILIESKTPVRNEPAQGSHHIADPAKRYEPFPLTEIQQAYWLGRTRAFELGNVACQGYAEIDCLEIDPSRLASAWQKLVERHDMLRARITASGMQQVEPVAKPNLLEQIDLSPLDESSQRQELAKLREARSHLKLDPRSPHLFRISLVQLGSSRSRLLMNIDLLMCDFYSLGILSRDLHKLYQEPWSDIAPLELTFRDYLASLQISTDTKAETDRNYWLERIETLPAAPSLEMATKFENVSAPRFSRMETRLDPSIWKSLQERGRAAGATPSVLVLSAFSRCLAEFSSSDNFTLNLTLFSRKDIHPEVQSVVGDFTMIDLLEVQNASDPSFARLANRIQERLWKDLEHDSTTGMQVLRELGNRKKATRKALLPVVFTSTIGQALSEQADSPFAWIGQEVWGISQTPQVALDHQVMEDVNGLLLRWDYVEQLFDPSQVQRMFKRYQEILADVASQDSAWIGHPPRISEKTPQFESGKIVKNQRPTGFPEGSIKDPEEKLRFKLARKNLRTDLKAGIVQLDDSFADPVHLAKIISRRSHRRFLQEPVPLQSVGALLRSLSQRNLDPLPFPKASYASAGGFYPVQVYICAKANGIGSFPEVAWWYDPSRHILVDAKRTARGSQPLPASGNGTLLSQSAFQIHLVADRQAIEPVYGDWWREFCLIEVGAICQLLESEAPACDLGVCQIGAFPSEYVHSILDLAPDQEHIHTLVAGPISAAEKSFSSLVRENESIARTIRSIGISDHSEIEPAQELPQPTQLESVQVLVVSQTNDDILGTLQEIWRELLQDGPYNPGENFFDAGGNSLLAVQLANAIRSTWNLDVDTVAVFEAPSLRDQESMIKTLLDGAKPVATAKETPASVVAPGSLRAKMMQARGAVAGK